MSRKRYSIQPKRDTVCATEDCRTHGGAQPMGSMRIQMLADATDGRDNAKGLIAKANRKIVKDTVVTP